MSAQAMQTAAGFVQQLAADLNSGDLELPMFPDSVIRIQRALQSKDVDLDEVVRIIGSDPALVARVLQVSNSAALRAAQEIVDVRQAVVRMGAKLVQSSVVAFALRQAQRNETLSDASRAELKKIWKESVEVAARCHVISKNFTKLDANEALLTGLLSVLGQLYIFMKSQEYGEIEYSEMESVLAEWHPAIGKAIAESWNMPDELVAALETQLDSDPPLRESASLSEVLAAARLLMRHEGSEDQLDGNQFPLLLRLGIANHDASPVTLDEYAEEIDTIRRRLIE